MALIKQFGLAGLNENVQFGKGNGRLKFDTSSNAFSIRNLADSDLVNIRVKNPIIDSDAATKEYVDSVSQGLRPKASVRVATNSLTSIDDNVQSGVITDDMSNLTYNSGPDTWTLAGGVIDNVTLAENDRVLIKDAAGGDAVGNGIFVYNGAGTLTRATDADNLNPSGGAVSTSFDDIVKTGSTTGWEIGAATLTWPTSATTSYGPDTNLGQDEEGEQTGHAVVAKEIAGDGTVIMFGQGGTYQDTDPNFHLYKFDSNGNRTHIGSIQTTTVSSTFGYDQSSTPSQHADFTKNSSGEYKIVVGSLNAGFQVWDVATNTMDYEVVSEMGNNADDVACDGDYVVACNHGDSTIPGGTPSAVKGYARVFNLADGSHVHDLVPPSWDGFNTTGAGFGYRGGIKLHGNWVAVGSSEWELNSPGRVDIFNVTTGAHVRTLRSSGADYPSADPGSEADDFYNVRWFGRQFQIDGDTIAIGMAGEPQTGYNGSGGMVEIYDLTSGSRLARLQNPNGNQGFSTVGYHHEMARYALDIHGDYVAVDGGDWRQNGASSGNRVVYLFNWRTGAVQEIYQTTGVDNDDFGQEIGLSGEKLFIGAAFDDTGGTVNPGRVYQYNATSQAGSPETLIVNGTAMDIQGTPAQCVQTINTLFAIPRLVASVNGQGQLVLTYSPNASDDSLTIDASSAATTGLPSGTWQPVSSTEGTQSAYGSEFGGGVFTFVLEGRAWADTAWVVSSPTGNANIGTDPINWVQFSRVTGIYADDGLAKDGNRVYVRTDGQTIHIDNDDVAVKSSNTQYQSLISDGAGGTANWGAISLNEADATQNALRRDRGGFGADVSAFADQSLYLSNGSITVELPVGNAGEVLTVDQSGNLVYSTIVNVIGTLDEAQGGTGESTYNQYDLLIGDGSNGLTKLPVGNTGQVLVVDSSGALVWGAVNFGDSSAYTGILPEGHGGTGQSYYTKGDIVYAQFSAADGALSKLGIGSSGQVLTVDSNGLPAWANGLSGVSSTRQLALSTSTGTISIGSVIPANSRVTSVTVSIDTAYDSGVSMIVGDPSNADALATADEIDPQTTGIYKIDLMHYYSASTQLSISISGTATTGSGYIIVDYVAT